MSMYRKRLLSGTSVVVLAALAGMASTQVRAEPTPTLATIDSGPSTRDGRGSSAVARNAIDSVLNQVNATVSASVSGNSGTVSQGNQPGNTTTTTVNGNTAQATARGNLNDNAVLQLDAAPSASGNGGATNNASAPSIAVLAVSHTTDSTVTSSADNNVFSSALTDGTAGATAVTGNTIEALSALNQSGNLVTGALPATATTAAANGGASNALTFDGTRITAAGGILVGNLQTNASDTGKTNTSSASLGLAPGSGGNTVALTDNTTAGGTITQSPTLSDNTLAALMRGNHAGNAVQIQATSGGGTTLSVPVLVGNSQQNDASQVLSATNQNSAVVATLGSTSPDVGNTLAGALTVTGNAVAAAATGNDAATPATIQIRNADGTLTTLAARGNAVSVADGIAVPAGITTANDPRGESTTGQSNAVTASLDSSPAATVRADLGAFNAQLNQGTVSAATINGQVTSAVASLGGPGGIVTMTGNSVTADVLGNTAANSVAAGGANTGALGATSAITSVQTNGGSRVTQGGEQDQPTISGFVSPTATEAPLTAVNIDGHITADVATNPGYPAPYAYIPGEGYVQVGPGRAPDTLTGVVTLSGNTISASSSANVVTNTAALQASSLSTTTAAASATSDRTGTGDGIPGTSAAVGGHTINTVQASLGTGPVISETDAPSVALTAGNFGAPLAGATLTVNANDLLSTALGNQGTSSLALTGSSVTASGALTNQQTSQAPVQAFLQGGTVTLTATGGNIEGAGISNSVLTASSNLLRAMGDGNAAANTLAVQGSAVTGAAETNGNGGFFGGSARVGGAFDTGRAPAFAQGLTALTSDQSTTNGVSATLDTGDLKAGTGVRLVLQGDVAGGSAAADGNEVIAAARANVASNAVSITGVNGAGSLSAPNFFAPSVAALANQQTTANDAVSGTVNTGAAPAISIVAGSLAAAPLSASGNAVAAVATGSQATDSLTVAQTTVTAPTAGQSGSESFGGLFAGGASFFGGGAAGTQAAFSVASLQASSPGDTRQASLTSGGLAVVFGSDTGSAVTAAGNQFAALATDNSAANSLALGGIPTVALVNGVPATTADPAATISASAAVANGQQSAAAVTATLGNAGAPVTVALVPNGDLNAAPLTVSGSLFQGSALGNTATNSLTVDATVVGSSFRPTDAGPANSAGAQAAIYGGFTGGDLTLSNSQTAGLDAGGSASAQLLSATTHAAITILGGGELGEAVANGSALTVTGNAFQANAAANTAVNTLSATGTTVAATTGLANAQLNSAQVLANASDTAITVAAGAVTASRVDLDNNTSLASALGNTATNLLTAGAGTLATGNAALASNQFNVAPITANGGMSITYAGVSGGAAALSLQNNTSSAVAGANTATNMLTGSANSYAALAAGDTAAINAVGAGASFGGTAAGNAQGFEAPSYASAQYAVANDQYNRAAVTATNTSRMLMTSNNGGGFTASTAQVSGNTVSANAYANSAYNAVALNSVPSGTGTAAVTNSQFNTGAVTAAVTNTAIGLTSGGFVGNAGSTFGVNNNAIVASATGNSATNVIGRLTR